MSRAPSVIPEHLIGAPAPPSSRCRVKGCRRPRERGWIDEYGGRKAAEVDGRQLEHPPRDHGFCAHHVLDAPSAFLRRWQAAKSQEALFRLWQTIEDDWTISGG